MGFSSQWNFGRKIHSWPASLMRISSREIWLVKSSCWLRTLAHWCFSFAFYNVVLAFRQAQRRGVCLFLLFLYNIFWPNWLLESYFLFGIIFGLKNTVDCAIFRKFPDFFRVCQNFDSTFFCTLIWRKSACENQLKWCLLWCSHDKMSHILYCDLYIYGQIFLLALLVRDCSATGKNILLL